MEAAARPARRAPVLQIVAGRRLELAAFGVLTALAVALWLAYPVLPTFDSAWAIL